MVAWARSSLSKGGVRQRCMLAPLAPYLFLIVGEVLNYIFKRALGEEKFSGVRLSSRKQQCISQYADNSSFFICGKKACIDKMVRL